MPKTTDVPKALKEFNKIFESIAYRHDYSIVFQDFLDFTLKGFSPWDNFDQLNRYAQERYSLKERHRFGQLIYEFIRVMDRQITSDRDWFDLLGTYYEILSSQGKKASLGQFFTPAQLSNLIAQFTGHEGMTGQLINEPCSGSGRFIAAMHTHYPGNYFIAEDIDPICCKMTAINMVMHGVVGMIINHDALVRNDFRGAWVINEILGKRRIPSIRKITQQEVSFFYTIWRSQSRQLFKKVEPSKESARAGERPLQPTETKVEKVNQLTLF